VQNALIFCHRKRAVAILLKSLQTPGFHAGALHGDMDQRARMDTLEAFRNGEITLLAASDVAARGLDIPAVSHIYNFDVPVQAEDYVHRIGRTGRAGREGYSATLVTGDDGRILKEIGAFTSGEMEWIGDAPTEDDLDERKKRGRGRGRGSPSESRSPRSRSSSRSRAKPAATEKTETTSTNAGEEKPRRARRPHRSSSDAAPAPAERKQTAKPEADRKPRSRSDDKKRNDTKRPKQGEVVGMGDHVPAFLAKPVKG
ncbi:MAG: helicase-related protein, partial [Hyphomicrobiaceae bacterium]